MKPNIYTVLIFIIIGATSCAVLKHGGNHQKKTPLCELEKRKLKSLLIDATTEKIIGNLTESDSLFKECLKIDSKNAVSYFELSGIYRELDNTSKALEYAEKAIEYNPENEWYKANLALFYTEIKQYEKAIYLYKTLANDYPKRHEYLYALSESYLNINAFKNAIEPLNNLEELIGMNEDLIIHKHRLYLKIGNTEMSIKEIDKLINNNPKDVRYHGLMAELYETIGEKEKAFEKYQYILTLEPNNGYVHLSLFQYYMFNGDEEKSHQSLRKAFSSTDIDIDTKVDVLLHFFNSFQVNEAIRPLIYEMCEQLILLHGDNPKSYSIYADFLLQENKIEEALKHFKNAVNYGYNSFALWSQIVIIETELLMYEELEIDSKIAIELYPVQPSFYFFNGLANINLKTLQEAILSFETGKDLVVNDNYLLSEFYQYLGDVYHKTGNIEASDHSYDLCLNLNPNNPYVLNNFSYYLAIRKKDLDKAERMISKAIELVPSNLNYLDTYGWILFLKGNYIDAEYWIQKSLDLGGNQSGTILEHYGDILFNLNRNSEALDYWNKAILNGNDSIKLKDKIRDKKYIE